MTNARIKQAVAIGAAILTLSAGGAFAATTGSQVDVMSGPGSHFKTIAMLPAGDNVTLAKKSGSWCDISAPATGWVPCADVNGATKTSATVAPAAAPSTGWHGYDYESDPYLGPSSGFHETYGGSFS